MPAGKARLPGLGDARLPYPAVEGLQQGARMIALVGDQFARFFLCRRSTDLRQVVLRRRQRAFDRPCVALIGRMEHRRDDDAGVEINRVLGLVGPMLFI